MPDVRDDDQLGMDEQVIEDEELEAQLDLRNQIKVERGELNKRYKRAHERVLDSLEKYEFPEDGGVLRIGAYRISSKDVPAREVAFETESRTRVSIARVK